jgi:hypothetical protein
VERDRFAKALPIPMGIKNNTKHRAHDPKLLKSLMGVPAKVATSTPIRINTFMELVEVTISFAVGSTF